MRNLANWVAMAAAVGCLAACGGGGGGGTRDPGAPDVPSDPGAEATDPGPADPGPVDPGTKPDATDPGPFDPGAPDTSDVPDTCTCSLTGPCCDGCMPRNDGITCGKATECRKAGVCSAGECLPGAETGCPPVACKGPGTCDAAGACVYGAGPADGSACEALAGKPGSGACQAGACVGYGACDQRLYGQAANLPCNFDAECASGLCRAWGDGWSTWCAAPCGPGVGTCPAGSTCVADAAGAGRICRPDRLDAIGPGDASRDAFAVCNRAEDCASGLCLSIDGRRFCSADCTGATGGEDALCGGCGRCRDNGDELEFPFKYYCVPSGSNQVGQPCGQSGDCAIRFCMGGLCSGQCIKMDEIDSCPDGMKCVDGVIEADPTVFVCVPAGQAGRAFGETCEGDWACLAGVCRAVAGVSTCTVECADDVPCVEGTCVQHAGGRTCLAAAAIGQVAAGEPCAETFQCREGLQCLRGACLAGCNGDADCEAGGGTCFLDANAQAAYCAPACAGPQDCPSHMGCTAGRCALVALGKRFAFGPCRLDADCETGTCLGGACTEACSADFPCEGAVPIVATKATDVCAPCDPAKWDDDCNGGTFGLNRCIQGADGVPFCATWCSDDHPGCPNGARCYSVDGYSQVCAPVTGSCTATTACTKAGFCVVPVAGALPCLDDAECATGACRAGHCAAAAGCTADADCGCPELACGEGGACIPAPGGPLAEVEPDDAPDQAQVLGGSSVVAGGLVSAGVLPDVDLYRVHLEAGQALDVRTGPFCGRPGDTFLRLLSADGTPKAGLANDDIDPQGDLFSRLDGYVPAGAEDVLIEVSQSPYVVGFARFDYRLVVDAFTVAANDTCAGAVEAADGTTTGDLSTAVDTYAAPCTGYLTGGKDLVYSVRVPAGSWVAADLDTAWYASLYALTDCAAPDTACVAASPATGSLGRQSILWVNPDADERTLYLVVDSFGVGDEGAFELSVAVRAVEPPANDTVAGALPIASGETLAGRTVGAANDYDPGVDGCAKAALAGGDVVYSATLEPGWFATFSTRSDVGFPAVVWLATDPTTPATCLAGGAGFASYLNGETATPIYVVVDAAADAPAGMFELTARYGPVAGCFGPCDPETFEMTCDAASGPATLCACTASTKTLGPVDCDAYCKDNGGLSGACHAYTTPGREGVGCQCVYDCASIAAQCNAGVYTNCTCAATDPCKWVGEGTCDAFCAYEFPADHFDDPADCTPPG